MEKKKSMNNLDAKELKIYKGLLDIAFVYATQSSEFCLTIDNEPRNNRRFCGEYVFGETTNMIVTCQAFSRGIVVKLEISNDNIDSIVGQFSVATMKDLSEKIAEKIKPFLETDKRIIPLEKELEILKGNYND